MTEHDGSSAAWKLDGGMVIVCITNAGLRAIDVEQQGMPAPVGDAVPEAAFSGRRCPRST